MTEETALTLPDEAQFREDLAAIKSFQAIVRSSLVDGHDFGTIPGTPKPTLLKPGAEKMAKLLGLADHYEIVDSVEEWDRPLFRYLVKCKLVSLKTGVTISEGLGECNSMEAKYRWRQARRKCPMCDQETIIKGKEEYGGGWLCFHKKGGCGAKYFDGDRQIEDQEVGQVPNDDIYSQVNTILKMGKKRALVDAALSAGRLSELFTQDIEDTGATIIDQPPRREAPHAPAPSQGQQFVEGSPGEIEDADPSPFDDTLRTDNPNPRVWSIFWKEARDMGFDKDAVHAVLQVSSIKEGWCADGKTLRQAIDLMKAASGPDA